jgi:Ser/Thr protein kinase RdoA (MazF antagonist)
MTALELSLLADLAACFALDGSVCGVEPLGNGNVNATYRVETTAGSRYVLQRLNTAVFAEPERVMANLQALARHALPRLAPVDTAAARPPWQLPLPVPVVAAATRAEPAYLHRQGGEVWRLLTHIDGAHSVDVLDSAEQAAEVGRALGRFHALVHDLPPEQLADTLEGFHQTPRYYQEYQKRLRARAAAESPAAPQEWADPQEVWCLGFIAARERLVPVLEQARAEGRLQLRPIHGDPKVNNVMLCSSSGCAVAMVDLDTVKPGLLHYDIGDALRSGCNPAGEETADLDAVHFDLELAAAMLSGYLGEARWLLSAHDIAHLYDAIRLLPFELGLRFFSDHLAGNTYFKVDHPGHNLQRALVQFRLTASIEAQEQAIRALIAELSG